MWLLLLVCTCWAWDPRHVFVDETVDAARLAEEVVEMTHHAYDSFRNYAGWGRDELKPLTCTGHSGLGGLSTTLIDSLDMLAVLGDHQSFEDGVDWVLQNIPNFDKDANVSVFETNIRIVGGLLSAHMIAANKTLNMYRGEYAGGLLLLAADLADRLLWAFETPTRLPFGTVNLRHGVPKGESRVVCAACCATFSLEFGMLSILTGDPKYESAAKQAAEVLFSKRNRLGLLSTHLEVDHGNWVLQTTAGLGGDTDSAYEYFYKAADAFNDERYMTMFNQSLAAVQQSLRVEGDDYMYFVDADFVTNVKILNVRSLSAFWPGILAQIGHLEDANRTIHSFAQIVQMYGYLPESVCVTALPPGVRVSTFVLLLLAPLLSDVLLLNQKGSFGSVGSAVCEGTANRWPSSASRAARVCVSSVRRDARSVAASHRAAGAAGAAQDARAVRVLQRSRSVSAAPRFAQPNGQFSNLRNSQISVSNLGLGARRRARKELGESGRLYFHDGSAHVSFGGNEKSTAHQSARARVVRLETTAIA